MQLLATLLLFCGLSRAASVFLSPPEFLPSRLSPPQARLVLSAHLGLEQFEVVDQPGRLNHLFSERDFVGQGDQNALLLLVNEEYARDVVPSVFKPSFSLSESTPAPSSLSASFVKTCRQRAAHVYAHVAGEPSIPREGVPRTLDIFSAPTPANEAFLAEMATLISYLDATTSASDSSSFAALELTGIAKLATAYGRSSEQYTLAAQALHAAIETASNGKSIRLALVTYSPPTTNQKRNPPLGDGDGGFYDYDYYQSAEVVPTAPSQYEPKPSAPQQPVRISSSSSCFGSLVDCELVTNECSRHGWCTNVTRAGQACFACACKTTVSEAGKVENWAGERCERKDISGPFVLITGTVVTLILLIAGSVSLLYAVSSHELPSILTGGVAGGVRKE